MSSDYCSLIRQLHRDDVSHFEIFRDSGGKAKLLPYKFPPDYDADDLGQDFGGGSYVVLAKDRTGNQIKQNGSISITLDGEPLKPSNSSGKLPAIVSGADRIQEVDPEKDGLPGLVDYHDGGIDSLLGAGPPRDVYSVGETGVVAVDKVDPVAQMVSILKQREDGFVERMYNRAFDAHTKSTTVHIQSLGKLIENLALAARGSESEAAMKHRIQDLEIMNNRLTLDNQRLNATVIDEQARYTRLRDSADREIGTLRADLHAANLASITSLRGTIESDRKAAMSDVTIERLRSKTGNDKPTVLEALQNMAPAALPLIQSIMQKIGGPAATQQILSQAVTPAELGIPG
jgi:hypothetical protein